MPSPADLARFFALVEPLCDALTYEYFVPAANRSARKSLHEDPPFPLSIPALASDIARLAPADYAALVRYASGTSPVLPALPAGPLSLALLSFLATVRALRLRQPQQPIPAAKAQHRWLKPKKLHELGIIVPLVADLAARAGATAVVDIGCGRGHLVRWLWERNIAAIGVEGEDALGQSASRHVSVVQDTAAPSTAPPPVFLQCNVDGQTSIDDLLGRLPAGSGIDTSRVLLVGLHTCGNLGPDLVRMACTSPRVVAVASVGCCYHRMGTHPAFPTSAAYVPLFPDSLPFRAREGACHSERIFLDKLHAASHRQLAYRAVFEAFLRDTVAPSVWSAVRTSRARRAPNPQSFTEYVLHMLDAFEIEIDDPRQIADLDARYAPLLDSWKDLLVLKLFQALSQPVIERILLDDRLQLMLEHGFEAELVPALFNPALSPRCACLVASRPI